MLTDYLTLLPVPENEKRFVDKSMQLSGLIYEAMQRQGLTQRALAEQLGKKESEVSKWLSGLHNFTLKTLTRIEVALKEDLVLVFRDSPPAAVVPKATRRDVAMLADQWIAAPFQTVSVNPGKQAVATPAADPAGFTLRAA
jgi:transcriptional regulator with XRE-family HTH domain